MKKKENFVLLFVLCSSFFMGCGNPEIATTTQGELGKLQFSYRSSPDCKEGCNLDLPLLKGGKESIVTVVNGENTDLEVTLSQPFLSILKKETSVVCERSVEKVLSDLSMLFSSTKAQECSGELKTIYRLRIKGTQEGITTLALQNKGVLLDQVQVHVEKPSALRLKIYESTSLQSLKQDPLSANKEISLEELKSGGYRYKVKVFIETAQLKLVPTSFGIEMKLVDNQNLVFSQNLLDSGDIYYKNDGNEALLETKKAGMVELKIKTGEMESVFYLRVQ